MNYYLVELIMDITGLKIDPQVKDKNLSNGTNIKVI